MGAAKKKVAKAKPQAKRAKRAPTRALVIVESPAKARTIKKYLGSGFTVKACVGHVKDLPKSKLSVDIDNGFKPHYELIRGKGKIVKEIKDAAKDVGAIYLAPDPDREGEAIAWHLHEELGKRYHAITQRITFNEITERAVQEAIAHPRQLNEPLFDAQQARRVLDRVVGYQISPILWDKVRRGLSAGRVQSVAVRLIVERERAIRAFISQEYWSVRCRLAGANPPPFLAKVVKRGGATFEPTTAAEAEQAVAALRQASYVVSELTRKERRRRTAAPLITSKLQQEAAKRLRFTAKRTMMIAQQLYEGVELGEEGSVGLITYMRTDSTRIADEALAAVRDHIVRTYGPDYLPAEPNVFKNKKSAQEAHEAIRPTSLDYTPERVRPFLDRDQYRLYRLIWNWFVASQMAPAVFDQTAIDVQAGEYLLRATGSIMRFPGFLAAHTEEQVQADLKDEVEVEEDEGAALPDVREGDELSLGEVLPQQHFTQPPPRFSEGSLVRELEEDGIGRPSTYAAIMSTIVGRGYVVKNEGRFYPTELGELVTELLTTSFPHVLDVAFTARMEELLDQIEEGQLEWVKVLTDFYHGGFKAELERAAVEMRDVKREETPTEFTCEKCGEPMVIKWGRNGSFIACKGYPKCRNTRDYKRTTDGRIELLAEPTTDQLCPTCGGPMVVKRGRFGEFLACKAYPECKGTRPQSIGVACPLACGGYVAQRRSQRGRFFYGCSRYPDCTFAAWDRPVPGPCPTCGHAYLVRKFSKGDGARIRCANKECGYERDPELDEADAAVLADAN